MLTWRYVRTTSRMWTAGSVEEMLHAIQAAALAVDRSPGIRAKPPADIRAHCLGCGRLNVGPDHTIEVCAEAIRESAQRIKDKLGARAGKGSLATRRKRDG